MQKINRDNLKDSLVRAEIWRPSENAGVTRQDYDRFVEAAQAFYDITAPDYVPTQEMTEATSDILTGFDCDYGEFNCYDAPKYADDIFRAMIGELVE